jgi:hypothetical protein
VFLKNITTIIGPYNPQTAADWRTKPNLVSEETRARIERLLLERLSLRGICLTVGVGLKWLLEFIVTRFEALPDHLNVQPIPNNADVTISA